MNNRKEAVICLRGKNTRNFRTATNGSIKFLKQKKHNQYAVHPPTTEFAENGSPKTPKALCYVDDWYKAFAILTAYKAGTYKPGMDKEDFINIADPDDLVKRILSDYGKLSSDSAETGLTFADVFERYYHDKFVNTKRQYSYSSISATKTAYKNCSMIHDKIFKNLTLDDLQNVMDSCNLKHSSLEHIKSLFRGMYGYAVPHDITDKDLSRYVKINIPDDDVHGVPFSDKELMILWDHRNDLISARLIIMCLSGFRVSAYQHLDIQKDHFRGGIKTNAGKNRIVPIHDAIIPLISDAAINQIRPIWFYRYMPDYLESLNIPKHTPHDCRHTFSYLCDKYNVHPVAKKKMLGHAIKNDVSNSVYGHWTLPMLQTEMDKIVFPF